MYKIDKKFFEKYQKILLWVINTPIGRWFFGVEKMGHRVKGEKITAIFPNAIQTVIGYEGIRVKYKTQFFNRPEDGIKVGKVLFWMPVGEFHRGLVLRPAFQLAFSFLIGVISFHFFPIPIFFGTTDTFNSVSAGDGQVQRDVSTWSNAHDTSTGTVHASSTHDVIGQTEKVSGSEYICTRYFFPFDTSAIPDNDLISSAALSWYFTATSAGSNTNSLNLRVVASNQANAVSLASADFSAPGNTAFSSDLPFSSISGAGYKDMTLNTSGISAISKNGYTRLAIRTDLDINNTTPTGRNYVDDMYWSENASNKPKLTVIHFGTLAKTINGLAYANIKTVNGLSTSSIKKVNGI